MQHSTARPASKYCGKCRSVRPASDFHRMSSSKDGLQNYCAECLSQAARARKNRGPGATARANRLKAVAALVEAGAKECRGCGVLKDSGEFTKRAQSLDGLSPDCKACRKAMKAREYARHRDVIRERGRRGYEAAREARLEAQRQWDAANRDKRAEARGRRRALKRSTTTGPIDLDALWTGVCPLCELPMSLEPTAPDPMTRSLDHIIPLARGGTHEQSNLQWTHLRCNLRKGTRLTA